MSKETKDEMSFWGILIVCNLAVINWGVWKIIGILGDNL
jgi:hypothetical protein